MLLMGVLAIVSHQGSFSRVEERSAAVATPVIKNGIISKIEIESPGSGYDQNITFRLLDNGEEHGENSRHT